MDSRMSPYLRKSRCALRMPAHTSAKTLRGYEHPSGKAAIMASKYSLRLSEDSSRKISSFVAAYLYIWVREQPRASARAERVILW